MNKPITSMNVDQQSQTAGFWFMKAAAPVHLKGDVNGDGEVNISDVNALIDGILSEKFTDAMDINGDGEVNISDVNALIDIILTGK